MTTHSRRSHTPAGEGKLDNLMTSLFDLKKAEFILRALYDELNSGKDGRLLWLLEALKRAERLRLHLYNPSVYGSLARLGPTPEVLAKDLRSLLKEIAERLCRYRFTLGVSGTPTFVSLRMDEIPTIGTPATEGTVARWLVELATNGRGAVSATIGNFRNCRLEQCQKLFFAMTDHQKYCSVKCRQKVFSSTPEFREKHRIAVRQARERKSAMERNQNKTNPLLQKRTSRR
jgi:hypothetical protein